MQLTCILIRVVAAPSFQIANNKPELTTEQLVIAQ